MFWSASPPQSDGEEHSCPQPRGTTSRDYGSPIKENPETSSCNLTSSLSKMVRSARAAANRHPVNPTSLEFLSIPPQYLSTANGDPLLLWDSGYTDTLRRSYLFGTPSNLEVLGACNDLVLDGTFKVAPNLFTQLLSLHGITPDHYRMPLAYFLMLILNQFTCFHSTEH